MRSHNLHLKIDSEHRQRLAEIKQELGLRSISYLVKKFVAWSKPVLEQRYFEDEEQQSHYKLVNDDLTADRMSLHVYLKEEDYRWLKLNHQDLNFFSIAQIVRWVIEWGIDLLKQGFTEANRQLREINRSWKKKWREVNGKMEKVRQLFPFLQSQLQEISWVSIYNSNFSPLREIFLKC